MKRTLVLGAMLIVCLLPCLADSGATVSDWLRVWNGQNVLVGEVGVNEDGRVFGLGTFGVDYAVPSWTQNDEDPAAFYYITNPTFAEPQSEALRPRKEV